jgi:RNA polymerase sigma factor (sigma-70 family)
MDVHKAITQFAPALSRVVASYERDRALREDLLQEVLLAVITSLPRLAHPSKLKPFVFRIAHNRCLSHVAKPMRERPTLQEPDLRDEATKKAQAEQMQTLQHESGRTFSMFWSPPCAPECRRL